ncbi:hypothetical protein OWV82_015472 [Melia azedarach]|uniref:Uncharacterized protein n=1 Tax=Melia azedarach TaxID=155640 RepID=A0ACC1XR64_MELAZ|nr:hypothetical protein OWV82_015472 [Melia azedarach]
MISSHPEIDPSVYEPAKPEIPTKYDTQSSECKFAAKQVNIATVHADHEENQQQQGETKPDYQQAQSQALSEAKDKQRQPTVELPVPPLHKYVSADIMVGDGLMPFEKGSKRMEDISADFLSNPMYMNGPSQQTIQSTLVSVPSASANPKKRKTTSMLERFKNCFGQPEP